MSPVGADADGYRVPMKLVASLLLSVCAFLAVSTPARAAGVRPATPFPPGCQSYVLAGQIYVTCGTPPTLIRVIYWSGPSRDFCVGPGVVAIGGVNQVNGYGSIGTC